MICTRGKGTVPGKRADHIKINEAAKQTKLSVNAYRCKSRTPPSTYSVCVQTSSELPSKETGCYLSILPRILHNRVGLGVRSSSSVNKKAVRAYKVPLREEARGVAQERNEKHPA